MTEPIQLLIGIAAGFFIFGWITCNFVYGRKNCDGCFVSLVRGKSCHDCQKRLGCEQCVLETKDP